MTNAEAGFKNSLRPRKPEGSLGRTAQDVHLDTHTAPELYHHQNDSCRIKPMGSDESHFLVGSAMDKVTGQRTSLTPYR